MHQWQLLAQQDGAVAFGGIILILFFVLLGLVGFVIWLWALISAIKNSRLDSNMRLVWILVIVLTQIVGAILYLVIGNRTTGTSSSGPMR